MQRSQSTAKRVMVAVIRDDSGSVKGGMLIEAVKARGELWKIDPILQDIRAIAADSPLCSKPSSVASPNSSCFVFCNLHLINEGFFCFHDLLWLYAGRSSGVENWWRPEGLLLNFPFSSQFRFNHSRTLRSD